MVDVFGFTRLSLNAGSVVRIALAVNETMIVFLQTLRKKYGIVSQSAILLFNWLPTIFRRVFEWFSIVFFLKNRQIFVCFSTVWKIYNRFSDFFFKSLVFWPYYAPKKSNNRQPAFFTRVICVSSICDVIKHPMSYRMCSTENACEIKRRKFSSLFHNGNSVYASPRRFICVCRRSFGWSSMSAEKKRGG